MVNNFYQGDWLPLWNRYVAWREKRANLAVTSIKYTNNSHCKYILQTLEKFNIIISKSNHTILIIMPGNSGENEKITQWSQNLTLIFFNFIIWLLVKSKNSMMSFGKKHSWKIQILLLFFNTVIYALKSRWN